MTHGYSTGHTVTALDTLDTRLNVHNTKVKFKATLHVSFIGFFYKHMAWTSIHIITLIITQKYNKKTPENITQ